MAKTQFVKFDAELEYAQVFERNRDMGNEEVPLDMFEGMYKTTVIVDEATKDFLIGKGIPDGTGTMQQAWKETEDGRFKFTLKRKHFNPNLAKLADNDGYMGPPQVIDWEASKDAGEIVLWDDSVNLGNGTKALVKIQIYPKGKNAIITLDGIAVKELVEYEDSGDFVRGF
jgi:hypothetical protein